jgi:hypothetical protein
MEVRGGEKEQREGEERRYVGEERRRRGEKGRRDGGKLRREGEMSERRRGEMEERREGRLVQQQHGSDHAATWMETVLPWQPSSTDPLTAGSHVGGWCGGVWVWVCQFVCTHVKGNRLKHRKEDIESQREETSKQMHSDFVGAQVCVHNLINL